jgi:hypothetical protein
MVSSGGQLFRRPVCDETILDKFQLFHTLGKAIAQETISSSATHKAPMGPLRKRHFKFFVLQ